MAVVMPAYQEGDIAPFLAEIEEFVLPQVGTLEFWVVDDASPQPIQVSGHPHAIASQVRIVRNSRNLGHGPSALAACARGISSGADAVVHVDGDGQFTGHDVGRVLAALKYADIAHGERQGRSDPWFRRCLSSALGSLLTPWVGGCRDINTPLRAYRTRVLSNLLGRVSAYSVVPNVHFSILAAKGPFRVVYVPVRSLPRRGETATGSSWQTGPLSDLMPSRRLVRLCREALRELIRWRLLGDRTSRKVMAGLTNPVEQPEARSA